MTNFPTTWKKCSLILSNYNYIGFETEYFILDFSIILFILSKPVYAYACCLIELKK